MIVRSLGTHDKTEAIDRMYGVVQEIKDYLKRASENRPPTDEEIKRIKEEEYYKWYNDMVKNPAYWIREDDGDEWGLDSWISEYYDYMWACDTGKGPGGDHAKPVEPDVMEKFAKLGAAFTPLAYGKVERAMVEGRVQAMEAIRAGERAPIRGDTGPAAPVKVEDLAEPYLSALEEKTTPQTVHQSRRTLRLFTQYLGHAHGQNLTPRDIDRGVAAGFMNTIAKLDPMYGRDHKDHDLTLWQLLENHNGEKTGRYLSQTTIARHLHTLHAFWEFCEARGLTVGTNPFKKLTAHATAAIKKNKHKRVRLPFEIDELNTLFRHLPTNWRQPRAPMAPRESLGWLMVLALYQGTRLEEIASLRANEILTEHGIMYINLEHGDDRQLKNRSSARKIPLHARVIELGFLDYARRYKNGDLIFPTLKPGGRDHKRSWAASKAFGYYKRNTCGLVDPRKVFHSFRHMFVTSLRAAGCEEQLISALVGHEQGFTFRTYSHDGPGLKLLKTAIDKVEYPGLIIDPGP
ncbi:MAG: site-specific integrase [Hyphomicrobiales bacterium]|nr:site-specific integrase [Hyphomicrobiales bacterium]